MFCGADKAVEEYGILWAQLLELVCLHLLGKGNLSENSCPCQNIKQLLCASEAHRLKVSYRLHSSSNRNEWSTVEMKQSKTEGRDQLLCIL